MQNDAYDGVAVLPQSQSEDRPRRSTEDIPSPTIITENVYDERVRYMNEPSGYSVYPMRWYLLIVICVIQFTNAMVCTHITFFIE